MIFLYPKDEAFVKATHYRFLSGDEEMKVTSSFV